MTKRAVVKQAKNRETEWMEHRRCRDIDTDIFYPTRGEDTKPAKKICDECPVRLQCLEWALDNNEKFGILGGKSERERKQIRRNRMKGTGKARKEGAA